MEQEWKEGAPNSDFAVHKHYMDIINCVPDVVYWVDMNCDLKGYNNRFVDVLGLKNMKDLVGTPYDQFIKFAQWPVARVEALKLDDMSVIFSGEAKLGVVEAVICDNKNNDFHYISTRVPLFDHQKNVSGLVVVLTKNQNTQSVIKPTSDASIIAPIKGKAPRVLMVEDNLIAQKIEETLFAALNCDVDLAESGERALQLFAPGKYDFVLMDIGLQDTSGYIVTKNIRQMEKDSGFHVPIIALTAYKADVVKYDCRDYLMDGVITKPLTSQQAHQLIHHYVFQEDIAVEGLHAG